MYDDNLEERYELAMERIRNLVNDCDKEISPEFVSYFRMVSKFIVKMDELRASVSSGDLGNRSLEELQVLNRKLYSDVADDNYNTSFANPEYAVSQMGELYGRILSFLYMEVRGMIVYAYEERLFDMTVTAELFLEIYGLFETDGRPKYRELHDAVYWFVSDYSDITVRDRIAEQLDVSRDFAVRIVMNSNLDDLRYLYDYGEYITDNEIKTAKYLNSLNNAQIEAMAMTFTEGYRKGFELAHKDLSKKSIVNIRYCVGFERIVRASVRQFEAMGLKPTIYRAAVNSINKGRGAKVGYYSTSPNKQMDFDHRNDSALYMDSDFVTRKLGALKAAYEEFKVQAGQFAGPAVMESFGEAPFQPVSKAACYRFEEHQQKLNVKYSNEAGRLVNEYIKGEERSFTIIAYPLPEIGKNDDEYRAIFNEVIKINTLDYALYEKIQQTIIDVLDNAESVVVTGKGDNCTHMRVSLMPIEDHEHQTIFENCLADVNIPLGEVFTSPRLSGTEGVLNVSQVYLNGLSYVNLKVYFKDGMVTDYECDNFSDEPEVDESGNIIDKNKSYIRDNVLFGHETLPIGEFAIGTNTTAYVMANKFNIVDKLPILIVEKMGPHFALGDTCYTFSEDIPVHNPNGKEIISRDNEITLKRKTAPEEAYFNCHTDITIPYDEIGEITAVAKDGTRTVIIKDGRFVLPGTLELNEAFGD